MKFDRFTRPWLYGLTFWLAGWCGAATAAETMVFSHEHVLGTSLEIVVEADSRLAAEQAETAVLAEIERLAAVFSTYDSRSEFSRWLAAEAQPMRVSAELFELLQACDRWQKLSGGAFQPAVDELSQLWQRAADEDRRPTAVEIAAAVARVASPAWKLEASTRTALRTSTSPLSLNAIAKGQIIDKAARLAKQASPAVRGVVVNIGGDLRSLGDAVRQVAIANPFADAENERPLTSIFVRNAGVATSGNYRRGFLIGGKRYSHIIDPRTGLPAGDVASATVVAATSADADALATIFSVLPVEESLALASKLTGVECLLVQADGRVARSSGWSELEQPRLFRFAAGQQTTDALARADEAADATAKSDKVANEEAKEAKDQPLELVVSFELNRPTGDYRRPYVAVWLEDQDNFPVKTAVLWMQTRSPGPRWHRDLLRWYRNDRIRKLADDTELIGTVSSATRGPGEYKAVFDGSDDAGKPLPPGDYTLFIEAAREHGTYQLIRHKVTLGETATPETKLKGNVEIKSATVEYRPRSAAPSPEVGGE